MVSKSEYVEKYHLDPFASELTAYSFIKHYTRLTKNSDKSCEI